MRFFPHLLYVILLYASDIKEFKKLLRTKNNVLVHFFSEDDRDLLDTLSRVSESVKGLATIVRINCSKDAKLCKKINKESPDLPSLKHYYKGEFHLDYNRALKAKSLVTFLKDPTGDLPWDEDPGSKGVIHLRTPSELNKLVSRGERALIMFYAPWCGFCKRLKPVYERAASLLEPRDGAMAAMDVNAPVNAPIRQKYNISAFPTLIFFEGGRDRYAYPGRNDAESFVKFMKDPSPEELIVPEVNVPLGWKDEGGDTMVVHLEEDNFDESIARR
ncbi:AGAP010217PAlike, partial [Caligus rogercresseyi]